MIFIVRPPAYSSNAVHTLARRVLLRARGCFVIGWVGVFTCLTVPLRARGCFAHSGNG